MVQLSHLYIPTGKTIASTIRSFVSKVMSLLSNMLSRLVIAFPPRSKHLNFMAAGLPQGSAAKNPPEVQEPQETLG